MASSLTGVLVMAYGSPAGPGDVPAYYTHVRGGRPPPHGLLADLERRYRAIGGTSPLAQRTRAQVEAISTALHGEGFVVALGQKHAAPFIEDGMASLAAAGARRVVGLVLAPHYSALSVGQYHRRAAEAGHAHGVVYFGVERWHTHPVLVDLLAERVRHARRRLPAGAEVETLVTAHSLPRRALALDSPSYPEQLHQTAEAVAARAGLPRWRVAWQSAGRTPEPWIGPDLLEVIRSLPGEGVEAVVVCPAGFVSEHLEVLYDVDVEARQVAEEAGLALARTTSLDDDPRLIAVLADTIRAAVTQPAAR
jgi:ferrochelatase